MSFKYAPLFQIKKDTTQYRLLSKKHIKEITFNKREFLEISPKGLRLLASEAMKDIAFYLRENHLDQLATIIHDKDASDNDRYVASTLLQNATEAAKLILPSCQDTGTAIVVGHKGERVTTGVDDKKHLSHGIYDVYTSENLRYSQMAPLSMFNEKNTGDNLPAQIDLYTNQGNEYHFLFMAKGGGSANKTTLFQETKSLLNEKSLTKFVKDKLPLLGTAACPPYHVALVIGGTSAETNLKTVKLASAGYYDGLPTSGDETGRAFRDLDWEKRILKIAQETGIGAQFGGKYLAHDIRVIRLPRHAASNPVSLAVSCSADRNIKAKITKDGIFIEQMAKDLSKYKDMLKVKTKPPIDIDLNRPMSNILSDLTMYPVGTLLHLHGTMIVARDIAHAKIKELIDSGKPLPEYFINHPVYYAGPAKTPKGLSSGSFGPTTAGRMDVYVDQFQKKGGSLIMIAKGNRSDAVTKSCYEHGGFYLGSIGGPAAVLAKQCIENVTTIAFEDLGMEAVREITVKNFPAFIICDDKGNDLFKNF